MLFGRPVHCTAMKVKAHVAIEYIIHTAHGLNTQGTRYMINITIDECGQHQMGYKQKFDWRIGLPSVANMPGVDEFIVWHGMAWLLAPRHKEIIVYEHRQFQPSRHYPSIN